MSLELTRTSTDTRICDTATGNIVASWDTATTIPNSAVFKWDTQNTPIFVYEPKCYSPSNISGFLDGALKWFEHDIYEDVKDITLITDNDSIVHGVIMDFKNGDRQKSICSEDDEFNLRVGISICLTKYLLHTYCQAKNGSSAYNKVIEKCIDFLAEKDMKKHEEEQEKLRIEIRKAKRAEKKKRREERKKAKAREEAIDIQKEAYLRAMKEFDSWQTDRKYDDLK